MVMSPLLFALCIHALFLTIRNQTEKTGIFKKAGQCIKMTFIFTSDTYITYHIVIYRNYPHYDKLLWESYIHVHRCVSGYNINL